MSEKVLAGKRALVIGGSRGIGRSVAIDLAKNGARVGLTYMRQDDEAKTAVRVIERENVSSFALRMNLANRDDITDLYGHVSKVFGGLDILVYSAAITMFRPLIALSDRQLERVLKHNVISFFTCAKMAIPLMKNGGRIVVISSLGSQRCFQQYGAMGMAKACLEAAVRYLGVELAEDGINVNAVSAGPVDTESIRAIPGYEKKRRECRRLTPAGRIASPEDVSRVVSFLCKPESDWVRGQVVIADGGLSLRVGSL